MSLASSLAGWSILALTVLPIAFAARRVRHRWWPGLTGAEASLADAVLSLGWLLLICELLGTAGLLRVWAVMAAAVLTSAAAAAAARSPRTPGTDEQPPIPEWRAVLPAAAAVALVAFAQVAQTLAAYRAGITDFDSLEHHLTKAAQWYQSGSLTGVHHLYPETLFPYYPSNAELLHALGLLAFSHDVLSPAINLGFLALALVAAYSLGSARGAGPAAVAALAAVLAAPQISLTGGGTALTDLPSLACLLAAAALLAHAQGRPAELALVALAGGLAAGTRAAALIPVLVLLGAGVVGATRDRRLAAVATAALGLLAGTGFWYARNLVLVGTPLPGTDVGPLHPPSAAAVTGTSFADAYRAGRVGFGALPDGLHAALGAAWPAVVVLAGAGLVLALVRGTAWERATALTGIASGVSWFFLPFSEYVFLNVRYLLPAFAIGAVLLAVRAPRIAGYVFAALALAGLIARHPLDLPYRGVALLGALAAGAAAAGVLTRRLPRHAGPVAAAVLLLASVPLTQRYVEDRYRPPAFAYPGYLAPALTRASAWAQDVHDARIAIEGGELQYPLYGADLSNRVDYLGRERPDGGFGRIATCRAWRRAVTAGRYRYVLTVPFGTESNSPPQPSPQAGWTRADPAARSVLEAGSGVTIFEIRGRMDPGGCRG